MARAGHGARRGCPAAASVEVRSAVVYATAMVALAFVPVVLLGVALVLLGGHTGGEIEHPLPGVVVGGLVTSTRGDGLGDR